MADLACDPPGCDVGCLAEDENVAATVDVDASGRRTDDFRAALILFRCAAQLRVLVEESDGGTEVIDGDRQLIEIMAHHYSTRVGVPAVDDGEDHKLPPSNLDIRD